MIASALPLLLLPVWASAMHSKQLKLRGAAKSSDGSSVSSRFSSFLEYLDLKKEQVFVPAISLEEFAKVDSEQFEWVDPSEIEAGGTTCGFLKAPLGGLPDVNYPIVKVYVCVRFAKNQPAPRGNLAVHCGGPGALSDCVYTIGDFYLGQDNIDNYNIIGFDQRGMGRSEPSFVTTNCDLLSYDPNGTVLNAVDFTVPSTILAGGEVFKQRSFQCWNEPQFEMKVNNADGREKTYHFLQYSGSRQLTEDIERIRLLFGDQKFSIYGVSYGTKVMGLYATMYPQNVNLMVLDGNMDPSSDIRTTATDDAMSRDHRIEYFISACERNPGTCPVPDVRDCIADINDMIKAHVSELNSWTMEAGLGTSTTANWLSVSIYELYGDFVRTPDLCDAAEAGDFSRFQDLLITMLNTPDNDILVGSRFVNNAVNTESKPTTASDEWPFANYMTMAASAALLNVHAQDFAFGAYDKDTYVNFIYDLNEKYPGAGTQSPVLISFFEYSACYHWPHVSVLQSITPTPPIGDPLLGGIIAGQLYDPQTPYISTQNMRNNFPSTSLLTSRSVNHGLLMAKEAHIPDRYCQLHIVDYFTTGKVGVVDGTVCESDDVGQSCTIDEVIASSTCI